MDPVVVSLMSFVCFVATALLGLWLASVLPPEQLTDRNKDLVKEARRMLVALATLTLGLIIASANTSFEKRHTEIENSASKIIMLDATLAKFGPKANEAREALRGIVQKGINKIELAATEGASPEQAVKGIGINRLQLKLLEMTPENERENWLRSTALSLTGELGGFRWLKFTTAQLGIEGPFLAIMIFWLAAVFLSYGIVAPQNALSVWTMILVAAAMASAIFLTLDLDTPNHGFITISSDPLRAALHQIGSGQ